MKQRCQNNKIAYSKWKTYGGRGIKVCERWQDFINFYEDMKDTYQEHLTLDRIDNDKEYSKENCRWTTMKVQANNRSKNNFIEYNGEILSISQWSNKTGISWTTIDRRKKLGLNPKDIFKPIVAKKYYSLDKNCQKYRVVGTHMGNKFDLGRFNTEKEAIIARDDFFKSYAILSRIN